VFSAGSTYRHSHSSGGDLPRATWDVNSTCEISGLTDSNPSPPANLDQSFGNFTWNTPGMGATMPATAFHLGGLLSNINGDLTFISTGSPTRPIRFAPLNGSGYTLVIGGDFVIEDGAIFLAHSLTSDTQISIGG